MVIDTLRQDLRYGWRQLQRAPLFTIIASFSVAAGVIVAVSAFSLINTLLFKPLPVPDAEGIYHIYTSDYDGRTEPSCAVARSSQPIVAAVRPLQS